MSAARPILWPAADITIREFYGLTERHHASPDGAARNGVLLSHDSFRALFAVVDDGMYVGGDAVSVYLGLSRLAIERRLSEAFGGKGVSWRGALAGHPSPGLTGPALVNGRYRWSFVCAELEPMLVDARERTAQRRMVLRAGKSAHAVPTRSPLRLLGGGVEVHPYLQDARGRIVGALGQGSTDAHAFIGTLFEGGRIVKFDPVSALGHAWTNQQARKAWDDVLREVVDIRAKQILARLDAGASATERLIHGPGRPGILLQRPG